MLKPFPHYRQLDAMDCGPTCLRMIVKHYGRTYSIQYLRERAFLTREGVSMLGISDAAEAIGFRTTGVKITIDQLKKEAPLPCILHWNQSHFVVLYKIEKDKFYISDPANTKVAYKEEEFKRCWLSTKSGDHDMGTALLLEPGPAFYTFGEEDKNEEKRRLSFFFRYLTPYKREFTLNNFETEKRWQWERIQVKLFKISIKSLALEQYQQLGAAFFSQTTNILISFLAARAVVSGDIRYCD